MHVCMHVCMSVTLIFSMRCAPANLVLDSKCTIILVPGHVMHVKLHEQKCNGYNNAKYTDPSMHMG